MTANSAPPLVAHVIYEFGTGGLENGLVNILNRFPRDSYRHVVICLTGAREFADRLQRNDVDVIELDKKPGHDVGMYWRLWRLLGRLQPAIVHTRNLAALETQCLTILRPSIRSVHGEHGRDVHDLDGSNKKYLYLRRLLQPFIDRYIPVSRDLSEWLRDTVAIPADKIRQIYNGVDLDRFCEEGQQAQVQAPEGFLPSSAVVVGTVGRLAEVKDQATLLRAIGHMLEVQPELRATLRLIIVGDGPLRAELGDLASQLDLDTLVWFTGDRSDTPQLLRAMNIFVLPSLGEGISNTILEAMASALPVVATRVGGNPELVEDGVNGRLVEVGQVEELASALLELLENTDLRSKMGERGRERVVAQFNWAETVEHYKAVYDELVDVR